MYHEDITSNRQIQTGVKYPWKLQARTSLRTLQEWLAITSKEHYEMNPYMDVVICHSELSMCCEALMLPLVDEEVHLAPYQRDGDVLIG